MKAFSIAVAVTLVLAFVSMLESATVPLGGVSVVHLGSSSWVCVCLVGL